MINGRRRSPSYAARMFREKIQGHPLRPWPNNVWMQQKPRRAKLHKEDKNIDCFWQLMKGCGKVRLRWPLNCFGNM